MVSYTTPFEPDIDDFLSVIKREGTSRRLHFLELYIDQEVKDALIQRYLADTRWDSDIGHPELQQEIAVHRFLGYDLFRVPFIRKGVFQIGEVITQDTAVVGQSRGSRAWADEHTGPIQNWKDFEAFTWPEVGGLDFSTFDWLEKHLPENMGFFDLTGHILEVVSFLFGFETLSMLLYDDPALVDAVIERVGEFYVDYTRVLADLDRIPVLWGSDDMGFRTSLLMSPGFLREKILPWHTKCSEIAHEKGKPYLLHCCGQIEEIMDDFIDTVKIDAKHSFEDIIQPVTDAYKQYGNRIAILGGIDVDYLIRSEESALRERVRATLDVCWHGSGYCFGSGNSIANYVPVDRFLIMLDEAVQYQK
jgi:uroporphyrinogen decarboxylase